MKTNRTQIILWAVAVLVAARLTWVSIQHHMPVLDTTTITLFSLYGARVAAETIARAAKTARKTGANQS
ncbi:hypothetical protein ACFZAR_36105 [Streptomyces sp. NPDC008222]|uniref:hypothetical protein n=1 Tax=Streptomyces sp. NPDC008222 TaxID=3364820 RepID=UPI0036E1FA95